MVRTIEANDDNGLQPGRFYYHGRTSTVAV
jgi:hypothetical protein